MLSTLQSQVVFPTHAVGPAGPLLSGAERLTVTTKSGDKLHGVHIPPNKPEMTPRTLILGFAGNAWNSAEAATYLHQVYPHAHVVTFHYRGYQPSTGAPSAEALLNDAPLVFDAALAAAKPVRIVAVGFSIGSGVAASLAARRPLDGLILVTPFDSLKAVVDGYYPWLPVGAFFEHEIDATALLKGQTVPTAIIAGQLDTLIAPERTDALRAALKPLAFDRTIHGAGHNDIYQRSDFHHAMREALQQVLA